jgi:hypothetical protein
VTQRDLSDTLSKIGVGKAVAWRAAGLSTAQVKALVRTGELVRIRHGVYAKASLLTAAADDPCLRHAVLVSAFTSSSAVASHHSAALMYGLDMLHKPPDGTVTLTVSSRRRNGSYGQADVIRHAAELPDQHVTRRYGVPVTTAARTVADIARTSTFMEGVVVADSALYQRQTYKSDMRRVLASCGRWPGLERARQVVDFASPLAESVLESCARVFLHELRLPAPMLQANIVDRSGHSIARVDFCWAEFRTVAEADGLLKYNGREDAIAELKRDRLLREAGWEVVHFTWKELFTDPAVVAARIRTAFDRAVRLTRPTLT